MINRKCKTFAYTVKSLLPCLLLLLLSCSVKKEAKNWCGRPERKDYEAFTEIPTAHPWFRVYQVVDNVYAIYEPYNWQEVISYLIVGTEKALLFDTGMGLDSIQDVVKQLTALPVAVVNSHSHYDHVGGNADFNTIYGVDTAYTHSNAKGWPHEKVRQEVSPRAFCASTLPHPDTANYHIRPYALSGYLHDGMILDLGGRNIEVMIVPGHTPDCVALLDRDAGLLWTGDTYYKGPLWLFFPGTDLDAYEHTIGRLAGLVPTLKHLLPAHNYPLVHPDQLTAVKDGLQLVRSGKKKGKPVNDMGNPLAKEVMEFKFETFSFLIRKELLIPNNSELRIEN